MITSEWKEKAIFRQKNRPWLNYGSKIARRVLAKMKEDGMGKHQLSNLSGISELKIDLIIKGTCDLSLSEISNLAQALDIELIIFPEYSYSKILK